MLHILYGEDDFSRREALQQIRSGLGSDLLESNTTLLDGAHLTLARLRAACDALPFFTTSRLVVVEGLLERFEPRYGKQSDKRRQGPDSEFIQDMPGYARQMPQSTTLVLLDGAIKPANPLLKLLAPLAKVQVFPPIRGQRLNSWIQDRVAANGGHITPEVAKLLGEHTSDDLWSMTNEIDKLLLYAPGPVITENDVLEAISNSREASEYAFMDAIMSRQLDTAQRLLHRLLDEGTKPPQILSFITKQLGLILKARDAMEHRVPRQDIQTLLGLASSFAVDKVLMSARTADIGRLSAAYNLVLQADLDIKTGTTSDLLALDILAVELCRS
ncbi:MAG: DNA polymerase III subunit delta [Chloroflexi bacterium]|nr:DNA polymerase III subunit delta [Chloroflexota bacterium]